MGFIDAHMHTVFLSWSDIEELARHEYESVVTLAYTPYVPRSPESLRDHFDHLLMERSRLKMVGLRAFVGVGIHPRCINKDYIEGFLSVVEEYLSEADVLGEVGVDTLSQEEAEVLEKQLAIARKLDKPAIIHTPRKNKPEAIMKILRIIDSTGFNEERVVIDHIVLSKEIMGLLKERKFMIGLTIQPGKTSIEDIIYIICNYPELLDRIVLDSDGGRDPSDYLAVAKAYYRLVEKGYRREAYTMACLNIKKLLK